MFTIRKLQKRSTVAVAALVMILVGAAIPGASVSDRASEAWSERLTRQAEHVQDTARAARAATAWSQRLSGLAEREAAGMSDGAIAAWTERLTALADSYAAEK